VLVGEIWIEDNVAEVTVSVVFPDLAPRVAVIIVAGPAATEVARPFELTAATAVSDDSQVTAPVRFWLVPSE